ncbi:MAG TPA: enolase C-terminal domain-like protein [Burkholderiales bacterium]|nr:enolase C-terminal domain-like protein [Burkholderiales bacterium]
MEFALVTPYRLSSGDLVAFDPIVVEAIDADGREGWGEALIVPGYAPESAEHAWEMCCGLSERIAGLGTAAARRLVTERRDASAGASSALLAALEMMVGHPMLTVERECRVPLVAPCQAHDPAEIADEVERLITTGFRTLKVKVGYDWREDLRRVSRIQEATAGRAMLRLDANRGFSESDATAFASRLDPRGIELFEQPCAAHDWAANGAVASASAVPVMLDESIYGIADIERAAQLPGVAYVKLKLKKMGGVEMLVRALRRSAELGLDAVLGDGVSTEIGCWMEATVGARMVRNAGEMNGFLKVHQRLFTNPLEFKEGAIVLRPHYWPQVDREALAAHTRAVREFGARMKVALPQDRSARA